MTRVNANGDNEMTLNVDQELTRLRELSVAELREEYERVWGEPVRSRHKQHLIKRIIWRLQAAEEGWTGYSDHVLQRARELADLSFLRVNAPKGWTPGDAVGCPGRTVRATLRTRDPRLPMPGTTIERHYRGGVVRLTVVPDGFVYEGQHYRSLSAVARVVTGSHINGFAFFKLSPSGSRKRDG